MSITIQEQLKIGLLIENLNIVVPWDVAVDDIRNYGNPNIKWLSDQRTDAIWDDAQILGGLKLRLIGMFWFTLFREQKLSEVYTYILEEDVIKIKQHLEGYLGMCPVYKIPDKLTYYYKWRIGRIEIILGQGERFGFYYYISIRCRRWWF